ncbi:MAG: CAP domain-containing protein [Pseudomonadota bacterium]
MKRSVRSFLIVPAVAFLVLAARPCSALPLAATYPPRSPGVALKAANDLERELLAMINADRALRGAKPIEWNGAMSAVAREHAQDMAEHDYFKYTSPTLGTLEYRLHRAGVSTPNMRYAIFRAGSLKDVMGEIKRGNANFHMHPATDMGVGIATRGVLQQQLHVTLISCERFSTLEPFPTRPAYRSAYTLAGKIKAGLTDPTLSITLPNGQVKETPLDVSAEGRFQTRIPFTQGRGKYTIEILATGKLGPKVLDILHCYVGLGGYPKPPQAVKTVETPPDLRQAEQLMFEMINQSRLEARLSRLKYDERLAGVARAHSEDMLKNKFFAHVSPTHGDLGRRMKSAGIKAKTFTENLANNTDIAAAHLGLMDSPGHRKNILDRNVTHVGVGIVRGREDQLFITVNFIQEFPAYDTRAMAGDFRKDVNQARRNARAAHLESDQTLARIAIENSRWMQAQGRLGYARARELLEKEKLPYSIGMNVFQSITPPTPKQIANTLEKRYRRVGIGIVQDEKQSGERWLWTTVLLGEK